MKTLEQLNNLSLFQRHMRLIISEVKENKICVYKNNGLLYLMGAYAVGGISQGTFDRYITILENVNK